MSSRTLRIRTKGNFIFQIYSNAKESTQLLLKERLLELSEQHWQNFLRTQTNANKTRDFNAEIIGICVQTLITDVLILTNPTLTDLAKLSAFWAEIKEEQELELVD
jgi:hypothetical protein